MNNTVMLPSVCMLQHKRKTTLIFIFSLLIQPLLAKVNWRFCIILTLKQTQPFLSFVLLLHYIVSYVPTVLQEKVLVERQEASSLSPPGMEMDSGFDLGLDLGPWALLCCLEAPDASDPQSRCGQRAMLLVLG